MHDTSLLSIYRLLEPLEMREREINSVVALLLAWYGIVRVSELN